MNEEYKTLPVDRFHGKNIKHDSDIVTIEEPLEIRIGKEPLCITMRTPGYDFDLVIGFLLTEGIIIPSKIPELKNTGKNVVTVYAHRKTKNHYRKLKNHFFVSSSCGLCGRSSIENIRQKLGSIKSDVHISSSVLRKLPKLMRLKQKTFGATGGLHAAALFDHNGKIFVVREDVGRHNAVDKVMGAWIRSFDPHRPDGLLVSGRASFEIVQKALAAKIPIVAAVSAPSSLAVELARETGITLIAFLRGNTFNIYSRPDRIE